MRHRILFVCLGNICRSPTAEAVLRSMDPSLYVDSAGTAGWHVGEPPDRRSQAEARERGLDISGLRGRQFRVTDFEDFDLILVMDRSNLEDVLALAPDDEARAKVHLLREFDPEAKASGDLEVPDPYYGGPDGFAAVYDAIERACRGLLESLAR